MLRIHKIRINFYRTEGYTFVKRTSRTLKMIYDQETEGVYSKKQHFVYNSFNSNSLGRRETLIIIYQNINVAHT